MMSCSGHNSSSKGPVKHVRVHSNVSRPQVSAGQSDGTEGKSQSVGTKIELL